MIENLNRQVSQMKEDVRAKELEIDSMQKRRDDEDRDRDYVHREERSRAAKEIERTERQLREI